MKYNLKADICTKYYDFSRFLSSVLFLFRFYSCQRDGWGGWIANPMDCPSTTGFDQNLLICNYMSKLPR